ncbi:R1 [Symbiodinium natans]|uniref:R1 protein n=1 Tax=Symbiodinium natans TaxID=878477 RepID=A0A812JGX2_9DINO|nr:R1 [Symbiodinium natans]
MVFDITAAGFGSEDMVLHWGVGKQNAEEWVVPVEIQARTTPAANRVPGALQTPFPPPDGQNIRKVRLEINTDAGLKKGCQFVLHKKPNEWLKNGSRNFFLDFSKVADSRGFRDLVTKATKDKPSAKVSCYSSSGIEVAILASADGECCDVQAIVRSGRDLVLQYGPAGDDRRWTSSTRLSLQKSGGDIYKGEIKIEAQNLNKYLMFVLHDPSVNQWLKDGGRDFAFELPKDICKPVKPSQPAPTQAFEPQSRLQRRASKLFSWALGVPRMSEKVSFPVCLALEAPSWRKTAEPDAKSTSWTVPGADDIEVVVLATAAETGCSVHLLVSARTALVVQYGLAGQDRAWKFSKRVELVRAGTDKWEVSFEVPVQDMQKLLMFVLHDGAANRWIKHGPHDFEFEMPRHEEWDRVQREAEAKSAEEARIVMAAKSKFMEGRRARESKADISFTPFELQGDFGSLDVACISEGDSRAKVQIRAWLHPRLGECMLHFGIFEKPQSRHWTSATFLIQERESLVSQREGSATKGKGDLLSELHHEATQIQAAEFPSDLRKVDEKACQITLQKMEGGIHGLDFAVTAHTEKDGNETIHEPDIGGLGFVLKTVNNNIWIKPTDGNDATVRFSSKGRWKGSWAQVADKIVEQETTWTHMSLKRRYENCLEFLDTWEKVSQGIQMRRLQSWTTLVHVDSSKAVWSRTPSMPLIEMSSDEENNEEFWSWIFVWQRLSFQQLLTWERNTCTQPRMLAATTNQITQRLAELWKSTPSCRLWIRWTLSTMGRGGSAGQQIRDEILVIMHAHGIKEIHGTYYEQWHQKLHNNTTPADIGICRAIIAYLKSGGDVGVYWKVLGEHNITKEHLHSYSRPITTEPYMVHTDVGRLIGDFERYLGILRSVHDALDLQLAVDHAKHCLPGNLQGKLYDLCNMGGTGFNNLDEGHNKFMRIAGVRDELLAILNGKGTDAGVIKQLLVIDYTLETQQSVLVQGLTSEVRLPQLVDQMRALLTALVGHLPQEDELQALLADWNSFAQNCASQRTEDGALLLKALTDRISRVVGELSDKCQTMMGPKVAFLGEAADIPKKNIDVFVDEVLRGTSLMAVSLILQRVEPVLRDIAHLPPWQMISPVDKPIQGVFKLIDKMMGVQGEIFHTPTILLSGAVSGEEEVPDGVLGVLVRSAKEAPDILSHCAVRARNFGVLLATCFDPKISEKLASDFADKWVEVRCKPDGSLTIAEAERPTSTAEEDTAKAEADAAKVAQAEVKMNLTNDLGCSWCVRPDEMTRTNVGSKSLNLALLRPKLPPGILTPQAVALPYGTMQKSLTDDSNKDVLPMLEKVLNRLQPSTSNDEAQVIFEEAQQLVESMRFPKALKESLNAAMKEVADRDGEDRLAKLFKERDAWQAIKGVWSSLFALRPWVSLAKAGRSFHDLNMAVLVQELVEAKYAFVLHTVNPFTKDKEELYGEIVAGRGETLVGNFPGRALSFAVRRGGGQPRVLSYPSKSVALHTQHCLIFRSDSNGEDLEGFAGAGLFESVCAEEDKEGFQRLHRLGIVADANYRTDLLKRIAEVGWATEKAFDGAPQDIEGCVDVRERIFIVQSRPQV